MRSLSPLPLPVKKVLRKLGDDIRKARLRRRISMDLMAQRAFISRTTLTKVEKGDPSVALGIYASVIFILGLVSYIEDLLDTNKDELGRFLENEKLPRRIRNKRTRE
jgi:transcriptional regulator with XRE-family HTH domain